MPQPHDGSLTPGEVAALLADARERTLLLISPVPEDELMNQHNRLMSPVVWDMGHIAHFEELWLVRNLEGPVQFGEMPGMFNPFENPRSVRGELALPRLSDTLHHMAGER
ncbi:MAG TPA: DinB family protein, partial [Longimicrobium sp.]|nr:DinB family protein [Longimicrobium sp.]